MNHAEFWNALDTGDEPSIQRLLTLDPDLINGRGEWGWTPLHKAVSTGNSQTTELLLVSGAEVDAKDDDGETAMFFVADNIPDHTDTMLLLLKAGADVNARNAKGRTPLHETAFYGDDAASRFLIDHHADVDAMAKGGFTPLHLAAMGGLEESVALLLDSGASIDSRTSDGYTPLHYAVATNIMRHKLQYHLATIETLLQRGADVTAQTSDGKTLLMLAITQLGYPEIAELLVRYGAK